jgi:hypothetical protein
MLLFNLVGVKASCKDTEASIAFFSLIFKKLFALKFFSKEYKLTCSKELRNQGAAGNER